MEIGLYEVLGLCYYAYVYAEYQSGHGCRKTYRNYLSGDGRFHSVSCRHFQYQSSDAVRKVSGFHGGLFQEIIIPEKNNSISGG